MKNYFLILLALLILGIGGFVLKNYYDAQKIAQEPTVFDKALNEKSISELPDGQYLTDNQASLLNWEASKLFIDGYTDSGIISLSKGEVEVENGALISGVFKIDMNSISSQVTGSGRGQDRLTSHLKSADFFDVENFATSSLLIKSTEKINNDSYTVLADLTIKGITNPIEFEARIYANESGDLRALAEVIVDRTLWDIKYGSGKFFTDLGDNVIDDKFKLELDLLAKKV